VSRLQFDPGPFCIWVQHANHSATKLPLTLFIHCLTFHIKWPQTDRNPDYIPTLADTERPTSPNPYPSRSCTNPYWHRRKHFAISWCCQLGMSPVCEWILSNLSPVDLNEATSDSGVLECSGISWTIYRQSAPPCRQITTPTPHHSNFTGQVLFLTPSQQF